MNDLRLTMDVFAAWLQTRINDHPDFPKFLVASARQPDMPDRCTTVLRIGSGSDVMDGMFEEIPFRLQTRGREESVEDAEHFTMLLDDIIDVDAKNVMMPIIDNSGAQIGDVFVTDSWAVNKPKQLPMTDKLSRYQFVADYMLLASRFNEEA
jgi:hypothetical protein